MNDPHPHPVQFFPNPDAAPCPVPGCPRTADYGARGLCSRHHNRAATIARGIGVSVRPYTGAELVDLIGRNAGRNTATGWDAVVPAAGHRKAEARPAVRVADVPTLSGRVSALRELADKLEHAESRIAEIDAAMVVLLAERADIARLLVP